jgi:copper chaperone CopZ
VSERFAAVGMTCPHCQTAVAVAVAAVPGASQVSVDLTSGTVTVRRGQPLDVAVVAAAFDDAGYQLRLSMP